MRNCQDEFYILVFLDNFDILSEKKPSRTAGQGYTMLYGKSQFKCIDRKEKDYLVVVSGWAFDYRIFTSLDLPYNYIFFCGQSIADFEDGLKKLLRHNNIRKASFLGWSLGAFAVCNFASRNTDITKSIFLVSIRRKYNKVWLEDIKKLISRNHRAYLYQFYKSCFADGDRLQYQWFRKTLMKDYLNQMQPKKLIEELDILCGLEIRSQQLKKFGHITIVHGEEDKITSVDEAVEITKSLDKAKFICFEKAGHLPFLQPDFKKNILG